MRILLLSLLISVWCCETPIVIAQNAPDQDPASNQIQIKDVGPAEDSNNQDVTTDPQTTTRSTTAPSTTGQAKVPQGSDSKSSKQAPNQQETRPQTGPKYETYKKIVIESASIGAEIDRLYSSMPIGFRDKQQEYTEKIEKLKARRTELGSQLMGAAIEAYRESPNADINLVKLVINKMFTSISPRAENQKFDPKLTLELAGLLTKNGIESRDIYFQGFRAAFALQDFDQAELMLQQVEKHSKTELPPAFGERLAESKTKWARELEIRRMESATNDLPQVKIETTAGDFVVELFENHAPQTVANFISLVEQGFYDGLMFHLVKPGILIQSGCPVGDGTGDTGYKIACESHRDEIRHHFTGTISMSNKGRDTGSSQFFISHQPNPSLDGKYTVFGRVIENIDVIFSVNTVNKIKNDTGTLEPSVINRISVIRKRDHIYEPTIVVADANPNSAPSDKSSPNPGDPGLASPASGGGTDADPAQADKLSSGGN